MHLLVGWFLHPEKQCHFGRHYSWRNVGSREITSISFVPAAAHSQRHIVWFALQRERGGTETHVLSQGPACLRKPSCFDSVFEMLLWIHGQEPLFYLRM